MVTGGCALLAQDYT